eukprot:scaffold7942_cov286-Pinguiococcus_pyrenoidosus.AAC.3
MTFVRGFFCRTRRRSCFHPETRDIATPRDTERAKRFERRQNIWRSATDPGLSSSASKVCFVLQLQQLSESLAAWREGARLQDAGATELADPLQQPHPREHHPRRGSEGQEGQEGGLGP